jgi:competence protein ComEA
MLSRLLTRREQLVLTGLALAIVTGAGVLCVYGGTSKSPGCLPTVTTPGRVDPAAESRAEEAVPHASDSSTSPDGEAPSAALPPDVVVVTGTPGVRQVPGSVVVSVAGAVVRPGVFELKEGDRVQDLIDEAGGVRQSADLSDVNLAAPLVDGTTLIVPESPAPRSGKGPLFIGRPAASTVPNPSFYTISGWRPPPVEGSPSMRPSPGAQGEGLPRPGPQATGLIDLNHATAEQLESLPGIGPKLAAEVIEYRAHSPLQHVDDALNVSGIGPKRLEAIRRFVCVTAPR